MMKNIVLACVFLCCLSGCTFHSSTQKECGIEARSLIRQEGGLRKKFSPQWWSARFRFHWPEEKSANGVYDLILTEELLRPLVLEHFSQVPLWRIHRRANRDSAGHQLSLIFFAEEEVASSLSSAFTKSSTLLAFKESGLVEWWGFSPYTERTSNRELIASGSDSRWSSPLQRTWPFFITGASRMWMELLHEQVEVHRPERGFSDFSEVLRLYEQVDSELGSVWEKEGGHAFFHHLSALFGYRGLRFGSGGNGVMVVP